MAFYIIREIKIDTELHVIRPIAVSHSLNALPLWDIQKTEMQCRK